MSEQYLVNDNQFVKTHVVLNEKKNSEYLVDRLSLVEVSSLPEPYKALSSSFTLWRHFDSKRELEVFFVLDVHEGPDLVSLFNDFLSLSFLGNEKLPVEDYTQFWGLRDYGSLDPVKIVNKLFSLHLEVDQDVYSFMFSRLKNKTFNNWVLAYKNVVYSSVPKAPYFMRSYYFAFFWALWVIRLNLSGFASSDPSYAYVVETREEDFGLFDFYELPKKNPLSFKTFLNTYLYTVETEAKSEYLNDATYSFVSLNSRSLDFIYYLKEYGQN